MTVTTYTPALEVTLVKMIARKDGVAERFTKAERTIDLTLFLGEAGQVQTTKSLQGEASGGFTISFADDVDTTVKDSLYVLVEPMDLVEIRAAREPHLYAGDKLPLIMRGFVSSIRRTESMGQDGSPQRAIIISGHDFGKLWMIHAIWWELAEAAGRSALTTFGLLATTDFGIREYDVSDFISTVCTKIMNDRVKDLRVFAKGAQQVKDFIPDCTVKQGKLIPSVEQMLFNGPYWNVIKGASDAPWNELFVRDEEDGPHLVFRPAPYRAVGESSNYILPDAVDPGTVDVGIDEVVQWDVTRGDSRVANYFWVEPNTLNTAQFVTAMAIVDGSALDFEHGNNKPELFGEKKMQATTILQQNGAPVLPAEVDATARPAANQGYVEWYQQRRSELQAMNRDNSVFEDGAATIMGSERFVIGKYVRLTRGQVISEAYITTVSHTFQPLSTWQTVIQFERGTGFLERNKLDGSPYIAEGRSGPYDLIGGIV